ncbi:MAG TPA: FAD-dependent oxidoreductase [Pseudoflavonifractor capillosus]|uniref:FAD-dependent oxidoreductase n=1 Tax=Pseudoflavonifractor capillosus TaxID=106588 RepID=A0A921MNQ8_9FIRM|nr:FAD-dependent oxidoreductase [Pseudoflavonifractor capillosus]
MIHDLPVIRKADVVVLGTRPASIGAAVAAGREGAKTLLIERSREIDVPTVSSLTENRNDCPAAGGFYQELLKRFCGDNAGQTCSSKASRRRIGRRKLRGILSEMLKEAGVEVMFRTKVCAPIMHDHLVQGVIIEEEGERRAILAKIVIDCTGDIAARAGAEVRTNSRLSTDAEAPNHETRCKKVDGEDGRPTGNGTQKKETSLNGYAILCGCFVPEKVDGIFLAGQNLSGICGACRSHCAAPFCANMGQFAGVAAAMCARALILPRKLSAKKLQARLMELGAAM